MSCRGLHCKTNRILHCVNTEGDSNKLDSGCLCQEVGELSVDGAIVNGHYEYEN